MHHGTADRYSQYLEENLGALGLKLSTEDIAEIRKLCENMSLPDRYDPGRFAGSHLLQNRRAISTQRVSETAYDDTWGNKDARIGPSTSLCLGESTPRW